MDKVYIAKEDAREIKAFLEKFIARDQGTTHQQEFAMRLVGRLEGGVPSLRTEDPEDG